MPRALIAAGLAALAGAAPAHATFPGENGRFVLDESQTDENYEGQVLTMSYTGADMRLVTRTGVAVAEPIWSPSGRRIAYVSTADHTWPGGDSEIHKIYPDGTGRRRLTDSAGYESSPTWSPDGKRIAFAYTPVGDWTVSEIWVMNADGSNRRRLSSAGARDHNPVWSPGGYRIAFASDRSGSREIYNMATDGTDVRRVTRDADYDDHPTWAPTGNRLVWVTATDTRGLDIVEANALDGSAAVKRTTSTAYETEPVVSPNGKWIAYQTWSASGYMTEIWRIRRDGSDPRRLAYGASPDWQRLEP